MNLCRLLRPSLLFVMLSGLLLAGCDATSGESEANCEIFDACTPTLELRLLESDARPPANVSVLFKVDTIDDEPIAGLTPGNFDIFENERLVSRFEADLSILPKTGRFQYSIALLLDLSGSIVQSESLEPLKQAARRFVDAILYPTTDPRSGEIELGIWWFDGQADVTLLQPFTPDPDVLKSAIESITADLPLDNSTNLYGAVVQGTALAQERVLSFRQDDILAAGTLVIFTDGTDQAARTTRSAALNAVRAAADDLSFFTIGLGGEIDTPTLEEIGRNGFVSAANINELLPRFEEIGGLVRDEANSYYLLEYCSPKRSGENNLTIRASTGDFVGILSTKFSADGFQAGCRIE